MENLITGLITTVIGVSVVFLILGILWAVLEVMNMIMKSKTGKVQEATEPDTKIIIEEELEEATEDTEEDEGELIAILTSAIAASLNTSTYRLKIKSFKRVNSNSPVWNKTARQELIGNKLQ